MFLCIPLVCGVASKLKPQPDDGSLQQVCPRCHNNSLRLATESKRLEFFWIPLIPLGKKNKVICPICRWEATRTKEDVKQYQQQQHYNQGAGGPHPQKGGYNVAYQ
ncbi:hypothetical protein ACM66B_006343 [Microbotryomycetes sp. NB124-2]